MDFQYYKELVDISSENLKIHPFFQFVQKVHELSNCKKVDCDIGNFVGYLKGVLHNPENSCDDQKTSFISHYINFAKVFNPMSNLKKNEDYVLTLLAGLKFLGEENKSLSEKLREKKDLRHLEQQKEYLSSQLEQVLSEIEIEKAHRHDDASQ